VTFIEPKIFEMMLSALALGFPDYKHIVS